MQLCLKGSWPWLSYCRLTRNTLISWKPIELGKINFNIICYAFELFVTFCASFPYGYIHGLSHSRYHNFLLSVFSFVSILSTQRVTSCWCLKILINFGSNASIKIQIRLSLVDCFFLWYKSPIMYKIGVWMRKSWKVFRTRNHRFIAETCETFSLCGIEKFFFKFLMNLLEFDVEISWTELISVWLYFHLN